MSTKQKKTIQKGSFKRLLKLFFFKNKMLTALMLFSIIISAVATALGPQYLGYATDSIVQDMSNPVSSNIHWDRFFFWAGISSVIFLIQFVSKWLSAWFSTRIISDTAKELRGGKAGTGLCLYRGREGTAGAVYHAAGTVGHHAAADEQYDE